MGRIVRIAIGEAGVGQHDDVLFTILGSCIAIMLFDKKYNIGGLAHIMLGKSQDDRLLQPAKYADTAVPYLVRLMTHKGAAPHRLKVAKIAGASEMFPTQDRSQSISMMNIKAVRQVLHQHQIRITAEDLGGNKGRQVKFDTKTGRVSIFIEGKISKYL